MTKRAILLTALALLFFSPALLAAGKDSPATPAPDADEKAPELPSIKDLHDQAVLLADFKECTLETPANYGPCKDPGDAAQLIDGQAAHCLYDAKGTVGWQTVTESNGRTVTVMLHLKRICFISYLRLHIAGGRWAGVALPVNIWVSASVDGKRYPMRLKYFPRPEIVQSETGHPFAGWLLLQNVLQTGRVIKIEFEMQDRGDVLLLDELQVFGLNKIMVFFRDDMPFWAYWAPDTEVESFGTEKLTADGNLVLNPAFEAGQNGAPLGVRVEAPEGTTATIAKSGDSGEVTLTRESGAGVVDLVLGTLAGQAELPEAAEFTASVQALPGASCTVAVEDPGGKGVLGSVKIAPGDWQQIKIPVTLSGNALPRIRVTLSGKDRPSVRLRDVRLAPKPQ